MMLFCSCSCISFVRTEKHLLSSCCCLTVHKKSLIHCKSLQFLCYWFYSHLACTHDLAVRLQDGEKAYSAVKLLTWSISDCD